MWILPSITLWRVAGTRTTCERKDRLDKYIAWAANCKTGNSAGGYETISSMDEIVFVIKITSQAFWTCSGPQNLKPKFHSVCGSMQEVANVSWLFELHRNSEKKRNVKQSCKNSNCEIYVNVICERAERISTTYGWYGNTVESAAEKTRKVALPLSKMSSNSFLVIYFYPSIYF